MVIKQKVQYIQQKNTVLHFFLINYSVILLLIILEFIEVHTAIILYLVP